jgi:hypothetical protein
MEFEDFLLTRIQDLEEQNKYFFQENIRLREIIRQLMEEKEDEE